MTSEQKRDDETRATKPLMAWRAMRPDPSPWPPMARCGSGSPGSAPSWGGEPGGGVSRFDGETWTNYTRANSGLYNDAVTALAAGDQGRVWMGTLTGLSVFDGHVGLLGQVSQAWAQAQGVLRMLA